MSPTPTDFPNRDEPPARDRGDACPGALRLHPADDGALARIRLPAGVLDVRQALALARAAEQLGDGRLDLTSRGNVQLRGLDDGCGTRLAELLRAAGLLPSEQHERVRNIVASPLSGLDGNGCADVRSWARELDILLCASPAAGGLSGRFLFALDDGRGDVAGLGGDVTLIAESGGSVLLRTGSGAADFLRIAEADAARAALLAAEAFVRAAEDSGSGAWRVDELPAGAALTAGRLARALAGAGVAAEHAAAPAGVDAEAAPPEPGIVVSPDGGRSLCVGAPLGRLSAEWWRQLAEIADRDGSGELRATPWRSVVVSGLTPGRASVRLRELHAAGLITGPDSPWHGVGACTGRPGCAKSLSDVRADAGRTLTAVGRGALPVYWSGCERRCGRPRGGRVDVLATGDGYQISVQGAPDGPEPRPASGTTELADAVASARATPTTPERTT